MSSYSEIEKTKENPIEEFFIDIEPQPFVMNYCGAPSLTQEQGIDKIPSIPERNLLGAVLERAFCDLKANVDRDVRRSAIKWFSTKHSKLKPFSFQYIAEALDLNDTQIKTIEKHVSAARDY